VLLALFPLVSRAFARVGRFPTGVLGRGWYRRGPSLLYLYSRCIRFFAWFRVLPIEFEDLVDYFHDSVCIKAAKYRRGFIRAVTNYFFRKPFLFFSRRAFKFMTKHPGRPPGSG
jgi:hypothetical protein